MKGGVPPRRRPAAVPRRAPVDVPLAVGDVLRAALRENGLDERLARYRFVKDWKQVVGEGIAARTHPESLRNGLLTVRVENSAWAQELGYRKQVILARLRKFVGDDEVLRDVRFAVRPERF